MRAVDETNLVETDRARWCLPLLLRERARDFGQRRFLSFARDEVEMTYREVDEHTDALATGFAGLGLAHGDRVLLMMPNRVETVLSWFALSKLGVTEVPVNNDYKGVFLEHVVNWSRTSTMVVDADLLGQVIASAERMPDLRTLVVVGEHDLELPAALEVHRYESMRTSGGGGEREVPAPSDVGTILFTSGTTGPSKGAMLSFSQVHLNAERNRELLGLRRDGTYMIELPLFHINGQLAVYSALLMAARVRVEERFSASRWLERVKASGATHTSMLNVMLPFILNQEERPDDADQALESVWVAPAPEDLAGEFCRRFGVSRMTTSYGATEIGMIARRVLPSGPRGSCGTIGDFYEVRIVEPETDEEVTLGEPGEILVRSKAPWTTTLGYLGMPDRTVEAFRNLWYHTGDLGKVDGEGWLTFLDRTSDRIRRRGENIASSQVEAVIVEHPAILDCAVVAVAADERGGEDELKAVLVLAEPAPSAAEVWEWCDERLPYFAVPRYLDFKQELPRTPSQKHQKYQLRDEGVSAAMADRGPTGRAQRGSSAP